MKRPVATTLIGAALCGCVPSIGFGPASLTPPAPASSATDQQGSLTPEQARLRQQSDAVTQTVLEGAAVGAAAGGIGTWALRQLGVDLSDNAELIGTGVGALAGTLAGAYVAQKQQEYAALEDQLDAVILDARAKNQQTQELIATMQVLLDEHRRELAGLRQRVARDQAAQSALDRQIAAAWSDKEVMDTAVAGARKNLETFADARTAMAKDAHSPAERGRVVQLDGEVAALESRIETMSQIVSDLSRAM